MLPTLGKVRAPPSRNSGAVELMKINLCACALSSRKATRAVVHAGDDAIAVSKVDVDRSKEETGKREWKSSARKAWEMVKITMYVLGASTKF